MRFVPLSILGFVLATLPSFGWAACAPGTQVCVGQSCEVPGQTVMDFDKRNLIACLCDGACQGGNFKWKAMTASGKTCPAGQVMTGFAGGLPVCSAIVYTAFSCPTGEVLTGIGNGQVRCGPPPASCGGWCCPGNNMVATDYYTQVLGAGAYGSGTMGKGWYNW